MVRSTLLVFGVFLVVVAACAYVRFPSPERDVYETWRAQETAQLLQHYR